MKALVTGGSGFVGLNIVEALLGGGADVVVLDHSEMPPYALRTLSTLPGTLKTVRVDVAARSEVDDVFAEHVPDWVVHAAAITAGERREAAEAGRIVDVNVKGAAHVVGASVRHGARRFVNVSSGSAYGGALFDGAVITEETPPRPETLYAITKFAGERAVARLGRLAGLEFACVRLGSVFGPWERDTGVRDTLSLPFQIARLAVACAEVVLPQREPSRDWIYSRDVAAGIVRILHAGKLRYDLYNLASGLTWEHFGESCCRHVKSVFPGLKYRAAAAGETPNVGFHGERDRSMMSVDRLAGELGFRPAFDGSRVFADHAAWLGGNEGYLDLSSTRADK